MSRQKEGRQQGLAEFMDSRMPGCAVALREALRLHGPVWVSQCLRRGLTEGQAGWFWAAEGGWAIGTPTPAQVVAWFDADRPGHVLALANPMGA